MARIRLTREEKKMETRKHIMEAGASVFAQMGFHGASIDRIAEEAGYTKGAFYAHFESKEALFMALFEERLQWEVTSLTDALGPSFTLEQLIAFLTGTYEQESEEGRIWDLLKMEFVLFALREASLRKSFAELVKRTVGRLERDLAPVLRDGNKPGVANRAAWAVVAFESGMAIYHYLMDGDLPDGLFADVLAKLLGAQAN